MREHLHDILLLLKLEVVLENFDGFFVHLVILHHLKLLDRVNNAALLGDRNDRVDILVTL